MRPTVIFHSAPVIDEPEKRRSVNGQKYYRFTVRTGDTVKSYSFMEVQCWEESEAFKKMAYVHSGHVLNMTCELDMKKEDAIGAEAWRGMISLLQGVHIPEGKLAAFIKKRSPDAPPKVQRSFFKLKSFDFAIPRAVHDELKALREEAACLEGAIPEEPLTLEGF